MLAGALAPFADRVDVIVLALPRGGVPVAFEVAAQLHAPLDVFGVRKLGAPGHEEVAIGAIAAGGIQLENPRLLRHLRVDRATLTRIADRERAELVRREATYRAGRPPLDVVDRIAILVDDGLATGATMEAAVRGLRQLRPARIVVAVPVGSAETCRRLEQVADAVVCATTPQPFHAVGLWYRDYEQTTEAEVMDLLAHP